MLHRTMRQAASGLGVAALLTLAACGSSGSDDTTAGANDSEQAEALEATGVWARTSPAMADTGVVYMALSSPEGVAIVAGSVDASVAARVEIHETVPMESGDSMEDEHSMGDMAMTMQELAVLEVPAGETVNLEPGGLHIMLLELATPLELGATFDLTLTDDAGADYVIPVEVKDGAS